MVFLGVTAIKSSLDKQIHRTDRCDWSIFRLGLAFLDYCLNELYLYLFHSPCSMLKLSGDQLIKSFSVTLKCASGYGSKNHGP
jgi:hypothetical protein